MELTVIEMGKDIVVTAVDHELDAIAYSANSTPIKAMMRSLS